MSTFDVYFFLIHLVALGMSSAPGVVMYLMSHTIIYMKKSFDYSEMYEKIFKEYDERVISTCHAIPRSDSIQVPKTKEKFSFV